MLFGSRLLPQVARRCAAAQAARSLATRPPAANAFRAGGLTTTNVKSLETLAVRNYGTRSVWNVGSGRISLFAWLVAWTGIAGFTQEILGPFVFFHAPGLGWPSWAFFQ